MSDRKRHKVVYKIIVPKDWLDEKLRQTGIWTLRGIGVLAFYILVKTLFVLHIIDLTPLLSMNEVEIVR